MATLASSAVMIQTLPQSVPATPSWMGEPNQDGVEGTDSGAIWMVTVECVILDVCPPYLETSQFTGSLLRGHISSVFARVPSYCSVIQYRCAYRGYYQFFGTADYL